MNNNSKLQAILKPQEPFQKITDEQMKTNLKTHFIVSLQSSVKCATGILVSPFIVMTALHFMDVLTDFNRSEIIKSGRQRQDQIKQYETIFLSKIKQIKQITIYLRRNGQPEQKSIKRKVKQPKEISHLKQYIFHLYDKSKYVVNPFDYLFLELEKPITQTFYLFPQLTCDFDKSKEIYIAGYPGKIDGKQNNGQCYASKGIIIPVQQHQMLYYTANTDQGVSGAPIFSNDNKLIGLHTNGNKEDYYNAGVRYRKCIFQMFKELIAQTHNHRKLKQILTHSFQGQSEIQLNQQIQEDKDKLKILKNIRDFHIFQNLSSTLKELTISFKESDHSGQIQCFYGLEKLYCLENLDLNNCAISYIGEEFKDLRQLKRLSITRSKIKQLTTTFKFLNNLSHLSLAFNQIPVSELSKMLKYDPFYPKLQNLSLSLKGFQTQEVLQFVNEIGKRKRKQLEIIFCKQFFICRYQFNESHIQRQQSELEQKIKRQIQEFILNKVLKIRSLIVLSNNFIPMADNLKGLASKDQVIMDKRIRDELKRRSKK